MNELVNEIKTFLEITEETELSYDNLGEYIEKIKTNASLAGKIAFCLGQDHKMLHEIYNTNQPYLACILVEAIIIDSFHLQIPNFLFEQQIFRNFIVSKLEKEFAENIPVSFYNLLLKNLPYFSAQGYTEIVSTLLKICQKFESLSSKNNLLRKSLASAIEHGKLEIIRILQKIYTEISSFHLQDFLTNHCIKAAKENNLELMELILQILVNHASTQKDCIKRLLHDIEENQKVIALKIILTSPMKNYISWILEPNVVNMSLIERCLAREESQVALELLQLLQNTSRGNIDNYPEKIFLAAARNGNLDLMLASQSLAKSAGRTLHTVELLQEALSEAAANGHRYIVGYLLSSPICKQSYGEPELRLALKGLHLDVAYKLMENLQYIPRFTHNNSPLVEFMRFICNDKYRRSPSEVFLDQQWGCPKDLSRLILQYSDLSYNFYTYIPRDGYMMHAMPRNSDMMNAMENPEHMSSTAILKDMPRSIFLFRKPPLKAAATFCSLLGFNAQSKIGALIMYHSRLSESINISNIPNHEQHTRELQWPEEIGEKKYVPMSPITDDFRRAISGQCRNLSRDFIFERKGWI